MDLEKKRETIDCIKLIKHVIGRRIVREKGKVFVFFIDLKAAFDKIDRKILWEGLKKRGINEYLIEKIKETYGETKYRVKVEERMSEYFWTKRGVRQGCPLSPTLFNLYIADLAEVFENSQAFI